MHIPAPHKIVTSEAVPAQLRSHQLW